MPAPDFDELWRAGNLSRRQLLMWTGQRRFPDAPLYNSPFAWWIPQALDADRLEHALQRVIDAHATLRTVFVERDGAPERRVLDSLPAELERVDLSPAESPDDAARAWLRAAARRPFDLDRRLLHSALLRLSDARCLWYLNEHHLITDATTNGLLLRRVSEAYELLGQPTAEPHAAESAGASFEDFVALEREAADSPAARQAERHWRRFVADPPDPVRPGDRAPAESASTETAILTLPLGAERSSRLRRLSPDDFGSLSLFSAIATVVAALLHRGSLAQRLAMAVTLADRPTRRFQETAGPCLSVAPLDLRIDRDTTFAALLQQTKLRLLEAMRHRHHVPVETPRRRSHDVLLNLLDLPESRFLGRPVVAEWIPPGHQAESLQVHLVVADGEDFGLQLHFRRSAFSAAHRERFRRWLLTLLDALLDDPDTRIAAVDLLSDDERQALLVEKNRTRRELAADGTLGELFLAQAARTPESPALRWRGHELSYAALASQAGAVARRLRSRGVGPESTVGVCVERSPEMVAALLGILCAGGAYVPLDPRDPAARLGFLIADSGARTVVADAASTSILSEAFGEDGAAGGSAAPEVLDLAEILADVDGPPDPVDPALEPRNAAYVLYTSGSTGHPKGVVVEHRNVVNLLDWFQRVVGVEDLGEVFAAHSISFDFSVAEIFGPLLAGGCVSLLRGPLDLVDRSVRDDARARVLCAVPSVMNEIHRRRAIPASVRVVFLGGEAPRPGLAAEIYASTRVERVFNGYGPTETTVFATSFLVPRDLEGVPPIGSPIQNARVFLLDPEGLPVPPGMPGELFIAGAGLSRGYRGRPELDETAFVSSPRLPGERLYRSGDRARWSTTPGSDSYELEFLGRDDDQVKLRGHRIELGEIETAGLACDGVAAAAAVVREDPASERELALYWTSTGRDGEIRPDLRAWLAERLPPHAVPRRLIELEALPLLASGKLDRAALASVEAIAGSSSPAAGSSAPPAAPLDEVEARLVAIFSEALGVETVGRLDDFFELGGHSLLAVRACVAIERDLGRRLPVAALFETPRAADLARAIAKSPGEPERGAAGRGMLVELRPGHGRPPLFVMPRLSGEVFWKAELWARLPPDQPVVGLQMYDDRGPLEPHASLEATAACLAAAITAASREPYRIVGYSSGALVGYEVARQLEEAGHAVDFLLVLDTGFPKLGRARGLRGLAGALSALPYAVYDELFGRHRLSGVERGARALRRALGARPPREHFLAEADHEATMTSAKGYPPRLRAVVEATLHSLGTYEPKPYAGRVTLLRARRRQFFHFATRDLGWTALAPGRVDVHVFAGNHATLIEAPHVDAVARRLAECVG